MKILKIAVKPLHDNTVELLVWARDDDGKLVCVIEAPREASEVKEVITALGTTPSMATYSPPLSKYAAKHPDLPF